ncbi:MAG: alpha/beta hydrolase [Cellvibrio sp.]
MIKIFVVLFLSVPLLSLGKDGAMGDQSGLITGSVNLNKDHLLPAQNMAMQRFALYPEGAIPNSKPSENIEEGEDKGWVQNVSQPTIDVYIPNNNKAAGTGIIIFPGGAYWGLSYDHEGKRQAEFFTNLGITVFVVKYRMPNDNWMIDKSIGPLQDAQQAIKFVRERSSNWNLNPNKIGVIGFSAGGHLASTLATRSDKHYISNESTTNLRPDFLILVYPVISMADGITHPDSRKALLGDNPTKKAIENFSSEIQVSTAHPPTLLLHAVDDKLVDIENSILYLEALKNKKVSVDAIFLNKGDHGFFTIPRSRWQTPIVDWLRENQWLSD